MHVRIQKWGNSLGLRIPKSFAVEAGIKQGETVDISLRNGQITVEPLRAPVYTLDELLKDMTPETFHDPVDTGAPIGEEFW